MVPPICNYMVKFSSHLGADIPEKISVELHIALPPRVVGKKTNVKCCTIIDFIFYNSFSLPYHFSF